MIELSSLLDRSNLLRRLSSCIMELVVLLWNPLVSSKILLLLDILQCMLHLKYIFLDKRQMLFLFSSLLLVLLSKHLVPKLCIFQHITRIQYTFVHRCPVILPLAWSSLYCGINITSPWNANYNGVNNIITLLIISFFIYCVF